MALNRLIETHIAALCKLGWIWGGFEKGGDSPGEITVKERLLKGRRGGEWGLIGTKLLVSSIPEVMRRKSINER